jgi:hypothetical protein
MNDHPDITAIALASTVIRWLEDEKALPHITREFK